MILFFGRGGEVYITDVALTEFGILGEDIYIYIHVIALNRQCWVEIS